MIQPRPLSPWLGAALLPMLATLAGGSPGVAQEGTPQGVHVERVDVRVLNIDVHVDDRKGDPLVGLAQNDFQLLEHGKEKVKPSYFAELEGSEEPLTLVIYVDEYNLRSPNRDRALATLLAELGPLLETSAVPALVVKYDGRFGIVQGRTSEPRLILAALEAFLRTPSAGDRSEVVERGAQSSVREILRQVRGTTTGDRVAGMASVDGVFAEMRGYGQRELENVEMSVHGLLSFVRSMAFVPGPKAVVYVSDGLAMQPLDSLMRTVQNLMTGGSGRGEDLMTSRGGQAGEGSGAMSAGVMSRDVGMEVGRLQQGVEPFNARALFEALAAEANTYRVSFYPIKAPPGDAAGAESRTVGGGSGLELSDRRESLEFLARATGGEAHTSDSEAKGFVPALVRDYEHYYSLGIDVSEKPADDYTPITVKVKEKGARVRYRQSYLAKDFWARLLDGTLAGMVHGIGANAVELEVAIQSQTPAADGAVDVKMAVDFPIGKIGLLEDSGVHSADAKLAVAVLDPEQRLVAAHRLEIPLQIPAAAHADAVTQYYRAMVDLHLPPGPQRVGLGLWDGVAGRVSYLTEEVTIEGP